MANQLFAKKPVQMLLDEMRGESRLRRILGPVQLTSLGVGCIIGTGIFVLTGIAAHNTTGPALMVSFIVAGLACIFAALCYAEFASMIPVAGSAYAYAYATLGELLAWIIGWDLILEYAVASSTVAHGWSHYFQSFLAQILKYPPGQHPQWLDILGQSPFKLAGGHFVATGAYFDLPAMIVTFLITIILVIGIKESASFNAAMVITKVGVVLMVILIGSFYIDPKNWHPFAPYGWSGLSLFGHPIMGQTDPSGKPVGMLSGAAVIFFAYIGFDSVSTHAEEAKNPQRDVPIGIIVSLLLCTVLYIAVAAVITGMVPYNKISVDAPVAEAFVSVGKPWAAFVITFGALAGLTSVLLVLMLSQARVLLAMARDGLLPHNFFGAIHERFRTPHKSTILTGIFVALPAALLPLELLAELVNIGTLLAFVIVCAAVMIMRKLHPDLHRPFRTPLVPLVPICGILLCLMLMFSLPWENWVRLGVWLLIGFIIYFSYSRYHSVMHHANLDREFSKHGVTPGGALPVDSDAD